MNKQTEDINTHYTEFYATRNPDLVYPTEFVVRTFLAKYPNLKLELKRGNKVLDLGFGDGRNTIFLIQNGYDVYGTEITEEIVDLTKARLERLGLKAQLELGRNSKLPYSNDFFDTILGCHVSYYCDENESFTDNVKEFARVLKPQGYYITSLPMASSYIFKNAEKLEDGCMRINSDPYNNRNGYKLRPFQNEDEVMKELSPYFHNFSFGSAQNNYYGIDERVYWVVCQKK